MDELFPFLEIHSPDNDESKVDLTKERTTIGRLRDFNDIGLEPDPQHLVTRKAHCVIEQNVEGWWVIDNGSVNRTFVQRGQVMEMVDGRMQVADGDIIRLLGRLFDDADPIYWELIFRDPLKTQSAGITLRLKQSGTTHHDNIYLVYDWIQAKLFRIEGRTRKEIYGLSPQEHKLIRYMDKRNQDNGYVAVMCEYEEIIASLWGTDVAGPGKMDVNRLVWQLRKKIEPNPKEPQFLQTEPRMGYRLVTSATT